MAKGDCKTPNVFMGKFLHCNNYFCKKCNAEYNRRYKKKARYLS